MTQHFGLDVSLKMTTPCVVNHDRQVLAEGKVPSESEAPDECLGAHALEACRIGLGAGALSICCGTNSRSVTCRRR